MRQAVMTSPGVIEFRDVPMPSPGKDGIVLRIKRIGICGSDIHVRHGRHPYTKYPVVQGHEYSAVVEAVGPEVRGVAPGMKGTARPQLICGSCPPCRRGDYNICDNLRVEGFQAPGCAQEFFVTAPERFVAFPDAMTLEEGALVEPAAVAVHATGRAGCLTGENVAVIGAGTIGNLTAQAAKCRGARKVLISDISDFRLQTAREAGIDEVSNAASESLEEASRRVFGSEGFSVAFEAAGAGAAIEAAIAAIGKGGSIVVIGVYGEKPGIDLSAVGDRELSLIGTLMYRHEDYLKAVELISQGGIRTAGLVTRHFPFSEYASAYDFLDGQGDKTLKVMIDL